MKTCGGCQASGLTPVVSLGRMPPVNAFVDPAGPGDEAAFPLDLYFCERCTLVQLHPVVLMNYCGLTTADLAFVVDDTPLKQGRLVPGCHIPVADWTRIPKDGNIGCLMLSWNYRREVLDKLRARTSNARVLIPLPTMAEVRLA
jgi:hypothetical protein